MTRTILSDISDYADSLRRETLKLLQSVPEDRHNWRPETNGYSIAETAYFLHKLDCWFEDLLANPESAIFPSEEVQHYDRQEQLFVMSVLELDNWRGKRRKLISGLEDKLPGLVLDEQLGKVSWQRLVLERYLGVEAAARGRLEVYLDLLA